MGMEAKTQWGYAAVPLASLATCLPAAAQGYPAPHYRAVSVACQWDFERYCRDAQPGSRHGLHCLAQHFDRLSVPCGRTLKVAAVIDACRPDHDRFCKYVLPGRGRVLACLRSNADRLSATCTRTLSVAIDLAVPPQGSYGHHKEELDPSPPDPIK